MECCTYSSRFRNVSNVFYWYLFTITLRRSVWSAQMGRHQGFIPGPETFGRSSSRFTAGEFPWFLTFLHVTWQFNSDCSGTSTFRIQMRCKVSIISNYAKSEWNQVFFISRTEWIIYFDSSDNPTKTVSSLDGQLLDFWSKLKAHFLNKTLPTRFWWNFAPGFIYSD